MTARISLILGKPRGHGSRLQMLLREFSNTLVPGELLLHELDEVLNVVGDFVIRQALHEKPSVRFRTQPVIEHGEDAAIRCRTDQSAKTLFQPQYRVRNLVL